MGTARPKESFMIEYNNYMCLVRFRPQQKFTFEITRNGFYEVSRDNVSMKLYKEDFEKYFKVVEE